MRWVAAGSVAVSAWLAGSAAWGASFVNSTDAHRAPPPRASLEEPPPDDAPRARSDLSERSDRSLPFAAPRTSSDSFSLLFSPLHLLLPMLKLTAEISIVPHLGLSVLGGFGETSYDTKLADGTSATIDGSTYLIGGQLLGYPVGRFDGVEVGAQLQYVHVDTQGTVSDTSVGGIGSGVAIGPFLGYKWLTRAGFTADVQGGVQFLALRASAKDEAGNRASASDSRIGPLLNLDLGWSF